MKEAARSADQFLTEGLLLKTVGPDGGRVKNLQAEMTAAVGGHEPDSPLVVLVDERTASGSEIIAGALLELNRAGLVGSRTYGKGSVQIVYNLDEETRLKLTVAQYILANGRKIADVGIVPDIVVGDITLDGFGVRFQGWEDDSAAANWVDVVPSVIERFGWRGQSTVGQDLPLEIARRAVIATQGTQRNDILRSLDAAAKDLAAEQLGHLVSAFEHRDINWSPAESAGEAIKARVSLVGTPAEDDVFDLKVQVTNEGDEPLSRVLVELECDSLTLWSGRVIPVGWVEPQETVEGTVSVPLPPGIEAREDQVTVRLRADKRPPQVVGEEVLFALSSPVPDVDVLARLVQTEAGDHVDVTLQNRSENVVFGPEVFFDFPGDIDVELLDHASRAPLLPAKGQAHFRLALKVGDAAPEVIPLQVHVDTAAYRRMVSWPLGLPKSGELVRLSAPRVSLPSVPLSAPVGPFSLPVRVSDDDAVDHVVVFANGEKVGWSKGGQRSVNLDVNASLRQGVNRILIVTKNKDGISAKRQVVVRGEVPAAVDAGG
jgi:hypothetical protein